MYPDLTHTSIHGVHWTELIGNWRAMRFYDNEFIPKVQQRGAYIIKVRGASSAASAANAAIAHTRDWCLGAQNDDWRSMAVFSQGEMGIYIHFIHCFFRIFCFLFFFFFVCVCVFFLWNCDVA